MEEMKHVILDGQESPFMITKNGMLYREDTGNWYKPFENCGYLSYHMKWHGKTYPRRIHRLVAEAFIPNPDNLPEVNHKDGNKHNNNVDNLEWITKSDNMKHGFKNGIIKPSRGMLGKKNPNGGRKGIPIRIIETGEVFSSSIECEKVKGLDNRHINDCLKGRQLTHGGYHFEYV